jgi:hypothetical protein
MFNKVNYGKIAVVIFVTVLIWVWADLALDEELTISAATISTAKSANPGLWVSFDEKPSAAINKIVFRGPASKIADVRRKFNDGSLSREFFLDPEQQETMSGAGRHTLNLVSFLKQNEQIKQLGLTIKSCDPNQLTVNVVELAEKPLDVKCVDENYNPVKDAVIEPAKVNMFVPRDWGGEKLTAKIMLTRREITQARVTPILKTPYIELAPNQTRQAAKPVKVATPPEENLLSDFLVTSRLGITLSANLQGKYKVEVTNLGAVMGPVAVKATAEAKLAYEKMRYQVILEIDDSDKTANLEETRRELVYNFPAEYVRRDEITLNQPPVVARFKLTPLSAAESAAAD